MSSKKRKSTPKSKSPSPDGEYGYGQSQSDEPIHPDDLRIENSTIYDEYDSPKKVQLKVQICVQILQKHSLLEISQ
jgi:hypothetical protein